MSPMNFAQTSARTTQQPSSIVEWRQVGRPRRRELTAVLIIPEDFAKKFYTQQPIDLAFATVAVSRFREREDLRNPTQSYPKFYVYGVMLMATQIGMFDAVKRLSYLQPVHYIAVDFRDSTLVGENADIRSHVEIFLVGGMLKLMTFYALFRYKLAQRLKRSTVD